MSELSIQMSESFRVTKEFTSIPVPKLRINVFEFNFLISLFNFILGNAILPEIFEFWKVQLVLGVHITCGIRMLVCL